MTTPPTLDPLEQARIEVQSATPDYDPSQLDRLSRRNKELLAFGLASMLPDKPGKDNRKAVQARYAFELHHHPFACLFRDAVQRYGIDGLLRPDRVHVYDGHKVPKSLPGAADLKLFRQLLAQRVQEDGHRFEDRLDPTPGNVRWPYPIEHVDFSNTGTYSQYNWELFFHLPMLVSDRLKKARRYDEAREWIHAVFNPTKWQHPDLLEPAGLTKSLSEPRPIGAWRFAPFAGFSVPKPDTTGLSTAERLDVALDWVLGLPWDFLPFSRGFAAAMANWRDKPFDPHAVARARIPAYMLWTYMRYLDLLIEWGDDYFRRDTQETIQQAVVLYMEALGMLGRRPVIMEPIGKVERPRLRDMLEGTAPYPIGPDLLKMQNLAYGAPAKVQDTPVDPADAAILLSFCTPPNERLLKYWDTIEDRLYKIRNSLNLDGVFRQLPLFPPPIDPALLVRAAAAGLDISSVVAGLSAPPPVRRFEELHRRALDLAREVRGFGQALQTALEKQDAEKLAKLRQEQEVALLTAVREVKRTQVSEARQQLQSVSASQVLAETRRDFYQAQIDEIILAEESSAELALEEATLYGSIGRVIGAVGSIMQMAGNQFATNVGVAWVGTGLKGVGELFDVYASIQRDQSAKLERVAGRFRRRRDWQLQHDLAVQEITQLDHSIKAAEARVTIAEKELDNHKLQIAHAKDVRGFLESKYTNEQLYGWLAGELRQLHREALQLAEELARRSEAAYKFETGREDIAYLGGGYTEGTYGVFVAGDRLMLDLQRMGAGFIEDDRRHLEVSRDVSLEAIDPAALVHLRSKGWCTFEISDEILDLDAPGTYMRRLKRVEFSVPSLHAPITSVPMKSTLVSSEYRVRADDEQESVRRGTRSPVSVLLGSGVRDSGTWASDDPLRFLPFEGEGAKGTWALELPQAIRPFDYADIRDVVIHLHYTARDGGSLYRRAVESNLLQNVRDENLDRFVFLSAKASLGEAWEAFVSPPEGEEPVLRFDLAKADLDRLGRLGTGLRHVALVAITTGKTPKWGVDMSWNDGTPGPGSFLPSVTFGFPAVLIDADDLSTETALGSWSITPTGVSSWATDRGIDDLIIIMELTNET